MRTKCGFTLIEMMVTVSIIAILAGVIYASLSESRDSARNKALAVELKEVQLALETYRSEHGEYPLPRVECGGTDASTGEICAVNGNPANPGYCSTNYFNVNQATQSYLFFPNFISSLPLASDVSNPECRIEYRTDANASWYKLTALRCLGGIDATSGMGPEDPLARCAISCAFGSPGDTCYPNPIANTVNPYLESIAVYSRGGECK